MSIPATELELHQLQESDNDNTTFIKIDNEKVFQIIISGILLNMNPTISPIHVYHPVPPRMSYMPYMKKNVSEEYFHLTADRQRERY